jgi:hypothetical protein
MVSSKPRDLGNDRGYKVWLKSATTDDWNWGLKLGGTRGICVTVVAVFREG